MHDINFSCVTGRLVQDATIVDLKNGASLCKFTLATNRAWKDKTGEWLEETTFIECKCFGRLGAAIKEKGRKGMKTFVHGYIKLERWKDLKTNQDKSRVVLICNRVEFFIDYPKHPRENGQYSSDMPDDDGSDNLTPPF